MTSSRQVGHSLLTTLALMWLIRLTDFEAPQKLRPDFSVSTKERDFMTRAMDSQVAHSSVGVRERNYGKMTNFRILQRRRKSDEARQNGSKEYCSRSRRFRGRVGMGGSLQNPEEKRIYRRNRSESDHLAGG